MIPSGKRLQRTTERSTIFLMGKLTISMAIFTNYLDRTPEGKSSMKGLFSSGNLLPDPLKLLDTILDTPCLLHRITTGWWFGT